MSGTSVQLFATGVYGIVKVVGCFLFLVFVADSLGRRRSLLWTSAAQAIAMYIVGAYGKTEPPQPGKPVSSNRVMVAVRTCMWLTQDHPDHRLRILRYRAHLPVGRLLPVRLGPGVLDPRQVCFPLNY
jgi:hypothetical protein